MDWDIHDSHYRFFLVFDGLDALDDEAGSMEIVNHDLRSLFICYFCPAAGANELARAHSSNYFKRFGADLVCFAIYP